MNYELDLYIIVLLMFPITVWVSLGWFMGKITVNPMGLWGFPPAVSGEDFPQQTNPVTVSFLWMLMGESCPAGFLAGAMVWAKPTTKRWGCRALHRCQMGNQAVIELDDRNYGNICRKALAYDGKNHGFRLRFSPTNQSMEWEKKHGFTQFSTTWRIIPRLTSSGTTHEMRDFLTIGLRWIEVVVMMQVLH